MGTGKKKSARVTIKDVATAAEVSIATVSYVLNNTPGQSISDETRKKVLQFANLLGYECNVMARYLATGKTNAVTLVVKDVDGVAAQYYFKLITELSKQLSKMSFTLKISDYADEIVKSSDTSDAYITLSLTEKEFREFADTKYNPVIAIDSVFDDFLFYRVNDDYDRLAAKAKNATGDPAVTLVTYFLPAECETLARKSFDRVVTLKSLSDFNNIDGSLSYATACKAVADCIGGSVYLADSAELKAVAAVDAVFKAINRVQSTSEEHDIKV